MQDDHGVVWPTGMSDQDPAARERPLVFNPEGFLVAILEDVDQADQARAALADAGFAEGDLRVYSSQEILDSWELFQTERSLAQRVVGALTDDPATTEGYFGYARQGRSPCGCMCPRTLMPSGRCACWPTTRSCTCATTATGASKTSTSADPSSRSERGRSP
jgi:hypothetical protein